MTDSCCQGDEEGAGELDMDAFAEKLGPYLSDNMDSTHFAQLFMKIDADCGGTIDWYEAPNKSCAQFSHKLTSYTWVDRFVSPFFFVFCHVVLRALLASSSPCIWQRATA
jgi:hypothetical protein